MRFDDSLKTVLAADSSSPFGAQATFRQLSDLMARRRVPADEVMLARLGELRAHVPADIRVTVARGLAAGRPPAGLVAFFAEDEPAIASTVLGGTDMPAADWIALLPRLGPAARAVLRRRDDLDPEVMRALETFGATDFAIGYDATQPADGPVALAPVDCPAAPPVGESPFTAVGELTDAIPVIAKVRLATEGPGPVAPPPITPLRDHIGFEIADVVDRIASFTRERAPTMPTPVPAVESFRFEAGPDGRIIWTDAAPRGAIIGVTLARHDAEAAAQVDGVVAGAFRARTGFTDARLTLAGDSPVAGEWRVSGVPTFDPVTGRFTGFRGGARRPRTDEEATPRPAKGRSEGLRRLVHELRTPTNAIAGFSELIEAQLLGPVAPSYRERASSIRTLAADLVAAIEDLDLAARIEGDALDLRPGVVPVAPLLTRLAADLQPLAGLRGCAILIAESEMLAVACDDRAVERLVSRLLATMVSLAQPDETIVVTPRSRDHRVAIAVTRPRALAAVPDATLFNLDAEKEAVLPGAPLLGTGFALRLIRNLAAELGGDLTIGPDSLTLTLPAGVPVEMGRTSTN